MKTLEDKKMRSSEYLETTILQNLQMDSRANSGVSETIYFPLGSPGVDSRFLKSLSSKHKTQVKVPALEASVMGAGMIGNMTNSTFDYSWG